MSVTLSTSEKCITTVPNFAYAMLKSFKMDTSYDSSLVDHTGKLINIHSVLFKDYVEIQNLIVQINDSYDHPNFCFMEMSGLLSKEELLDLLFESHHSLNVLFETSVNRVPSIFYIPERDVYVLVTEYFSKR